MFATQHWPDVISFAAADLSATGSWSSRRSPPATCTFARCRRPLSGQEPGALEFELEPRRATHRMPDTRDPWRRRHLGTSARHRRIESRSTLHLIAADLAYVRGIAPWPLTEVRGRGDLTLSKATNWSSCADGVSPNDDLHRPQRAG